jgi:hypothetical protein
VIFAAKIHSRKTATNPGMQVIIRRKTVNIVSGLEKVIETKIYMAVRSQIIRTGLFTIPKI